MKADCRSLQPLLCISCLVTDCHTSSLTTQHQPDPVLQDFEPSHPEGQQQLPVKLEVCHFTLTPVQDLLVPANKLQVSLGLPFSLQHSCATTASTQTTTSFQFLDLRGFSHTISQALIQTDHFYSTLYLQSQAVGLKQPRCFPAMSRSSSPQLSAPTLGAI